MAERMIVVCDCCGQAINPRRAKRVSGKVYCSEERYFQECRRWWNAAPTLKQVEERAARNSGKSKVVEFKK